MSGMIYIWEQKAHFEAIFSTLRLESVLELLDAIEVIQVRTQVLLNFFHLTQF